MIKLNSQGTDPDYTEHGSVSTDCVTVGQFMTEAAATYGGGLTIEVDSDRYEFSDKPKIRVTDETPVGEITYACAPGSITFIVKTKPKPKTVKRSGWVNLYQVRGVKPIPVGFVYTTKEECDADASRIVHKGEFLAAAKVEWEEVVK